MFFHVNEVATLNQITAIHSQAHFHVSISASQPVRNIGIAVFAGRAVFARLRRLNVISSKYRASLTESLVIE